MPVSFNCAVFWLNLRRGLAPMTGALLVLVALAVDRGASLPQAVSLGNEDAAALLRGLRRTDQWIALGALLLPLSVLQTARHWSRLVHSERSWLLSGSISKASLCFSTWAGAWVSSLIWVLLAAGLCEWSAMGVGSGTGVGTRTDWLLHSSLDMESVQRVGTEGRLRWNSTVPASSGDGLVRLSVRLYGLDNQAESFEFSVLQADGTTIDRTEVQPALLSTLEVSVPAQGGEFVFELRAKQARRALRLHQAQLHHFVPGPRGMPTLLLALRLALILAAAQALVLGLGAWFTAPTTVLYVAGGYGLLWLEADQMAGSWVQRWVPGFDLPEALQWIAEGRGPQAIAPSAALGTVGLVVLGLGLLHLGLGRLRGGR
jgi:hypothetical protein